MSELYSKDSLEQHRSELLGWQQDAFRQFQAMLTDSHNAYPCILGRQGFVSGHLRFGFIEDPASLAAPEALAFLLQQYGLCSRATGRYASLVVFFNTPSALPDGYSVQSYEGLFWSLLSNVSKYDEKEWPEEIATDPSHHSWEFCFDGNAYFAFCATPAHSVRRSRHFPYFMLAFQPRWVFDELNKSAAFSSTVKKAIRARLASYDGIPAHPSLKGYGQTDNLEWQQYFLPDDNRVPSKCPFTRMKQALKNWL